MITAEDVRKRLAADNVETEHDDSRISEAMAAEKAAQRAYLDLPSPRPAEADEALLRRVIYNLTTDTDPDRPVRRIGIQAAGVRDLEARWSRTPRIREAALAALEEKPRRTTKRTTTRKAAKKAAGTQKENS